MTEAERIAAGLSEVLLIDPIETMLQNSYRNFHAKGLDYLCLRRSPELTVKAYFYDRPTDSAPEVVCPHDHRYPFVTKVLAGQSDHYRYIEQPEFLTDYYTHQAFNWHTPLNGGKGFEWARQCSLVRQRHERYERGQQYYCRPDEIHTIAITRHDTVLLLYQFADSVPLTTATTTYVRGDNKEPPALDGLYDQMKADHLTIRLTQLSKVLERSNDTRKAEHD